MEKTIIKFGDIEIKKPISTKNIDTIKMVIFNTESFG